jgi:hypothetical protein
MKEIAISEFRAKCFCPVGRGAQTKQAIRVTRLGRPIAEVVPTSPVAASDWMGSMKDRIEILGDIVSPGDENGD